ncbi:EpsG family protein [Rhodobacteraceae bacterium nBUS_22]
MLCILTFLVREKSSSQRKITGDTLNYINFYTDISIKNWSYSNCQGFEPLFCYVSKIFTHIGLAPSTVHTVWAFLVAVLIHSAIVRYQTKFIVKLTFLAVPLALNFFHPTEVYFLIRQFIAGAFLMNLFISQSRTSHFLWSLLAITTHFFSAPLIILF